MIDLFLGAALVVVPFFIKSAPKTSANLSQEFFLGLISFAGVSMFGTGRIHRNITIMAALVCFIAFKAANPFGLFQYHQLVMSAAGVAFIAFIHRSRKEIRIDIIGKCLGVVCLLESAWIISQYFQFNPGDFLFDSYAVENRFGGAFGSLGNPNHSAALVACTFPFLASQLWPIPLVALIVSGSTMPAICALVGMSALIAYQFKTYAHLYFAGALLFVAAMVVWFSEIPADSLLSSSHRVEAWKAIISDVGFQISGKGFGYIPEVFSRKMIQGMRFYQAHNEWIELYVIGGVLSVAIAIYLTLPIFKDRGNPAINACLISLLVNTLGNFTFHISPLFMVFGTCYALQLGED